MVTILYPLLILLIYFRKLINKEDPIRFKEKIFPNSFKVKYSKDASSYLVSCCQYWRVKKYFSYYRWIKYIKKILNFLLLPLL